MKSGDGSQLLVQVPTGAERAGSLTPQEVSNLLVIGDKERREPYEARPLPSRSRRDTMLVDSPGTRLI